MLYQVLKDTFQDWVILVIGTGCGFILTTLLLWKPFSFLPKDGGKTVISPEGETIVINDKSSGKVTGVGLVFVLVFLLMSLLFLPLDAELLIYAGLMLLMMITGYLDDASSVPWGELVKGLLDLVLSIGAVVTFLIYHGSTVTVFGNTFEMPVWLYGILGVILMWMSINVTNCSDGVDGLCGSVSVVTLVAYFLLFQTVMPTYSWMGILLAGVLLAYLIYNWNPSKVLMGDAGSRTIGFLLALLAMQSGHPFIFLLMSLVFIFDGGMGLVKVTLIRVLHVNPFKNVLFPFHDHMRKKMGIPIKLIPVIFVALQVLFCGIAALIV